MRAIVAVLACGLLLIPAMPVPAATRAESAQRTYCDVALDDCRTRCQGSPTLSTTASLLGLTCPSIATLYTFFVRTCSDGCVLTYQECITRYQSAAGTPA
jgi:hypothetical protein